MATHWSTDPLKSLDSDDLWAVMTNVPSTAGTVGDLLYFTPRALEHAATEDCILDFSWVYSALQAPGAPQTTDAEKQALRRFVEPVWISLRDSDPQHPLGVSSIVLPTAVLTEDISYYLDLWLGSKAHELYVSREENEDGTLRDAFWNTSSKAYGQVTSWLRKHRDAVQ